MRPTKIAAAVLAALTPFAAMPSSHREAPNITRLPTVDSTDVYSFVSYEPGYEEYVTLIANYVPLQDPYGGPNYFALDPAALYEIHIDNDGDARENITFQFRVDNDLGGNWRASFTYDRPSTDRLVLEGTMDGFRLRLRLRLLDFDTFRLLNSGFRWVRPPDPFAG